MHLQISPQQSIRFSPDSLTSLVYTNLDYFLQSRDLSFQRNWLWHMMNIWQVLQLVTFLPLSSSLLPTRLMQLNFTTMIMGINLFLNAKWNAGWIYSAESHNMTDFKGTGSALPHSHFGRQIRWCLAQLKIQIDQFGFLVEFRYNCSFWNSSLYSSWIIRPSHEISV